MELDAEDEDVDVIFEDSVLHQALLDSGITFLETESRGNMEGDEDQKEQNNNDQEENDNHIEAFAHLHFSLLARLAFSADFLNSVYHGHRYAMLQRLMSSRILSPDDRQFLEDFVEEAPQTTDPLQNFTIWTKWLIGFLLVMTTILNISPTTSYLAPAVVLCVEEYIPVDIAPVYCDYFVMALVNVVWCCLIFCLSRFSHRQLRKELLESAKGWELPFNQLESEAWELLHLERKCLRLLRESELVARGFTLASQRLASSHHAAGQRSVVDQLCPQLRRAMLTHNMRLLEKIKLVVMALMKRVPMRVSDCDFDSVDVLSELDMSYLVDEFTGTDIPLAPLSQSVRLLHVYISGFVRRLALCFYHRNLRNSALNSFDATQGCIQSCTEAIAQARSMLQEHHSFYRAIHRSMSDRDGTDNSIVHRSLEGQTLGEHSSSDQFQHFYVCVNSLDLHLQSVLLITRDLSSVLESRLDREAREGDGSSDSQTDTPHGSVAVTSLEDWRSWEETLKHVKTSLDSVQCCYEECMKHVSYRDQAKQNQSSAQPSEVPATNWEETDGVTVRVIPAEDPVIHDQVFEGETEPAGESDDEEDMAEWRRQRQEAAQQRARIQERRETMRHLRQELSTVVGHRAILHREREERALARARGEINEADTAQEASAAPQLDQTHCVNNGSCNENSHKEKDASDFKGRNGFKNGIIQAAKLEDSHKSQEGKPELESIHVNGHAKENLDAEHTALTHPDKYQQDETGKTKEMVSVRGVKLEETYGQNQNKRGLLGLKDVVWRKVFADVHQPNTKELKVHRESGFGDGNPENGMDKLGMLGRVGVRLEAVSVFSEIKDSEILPGIPYSLLNGLSSTETNASEAGMRVNGMVDDKSQFSVDQEAREDGMLDSCTVRKEFWKRPVPPRVHKTRGQLYVTPVNLITVGYAFRGEIGGDEKDDDDDDNASTEHAGDSGGAEDVEDGGGNDNSNPVEAEVENNAVSVNDAAPADENVGQDCVEQDQSCREAAVACGGVCPDTKTTSDGDGDRKHATRRARPRSKSSKVPKSRLKKMFVGWLTQSEPGSRGNRGKGPTYQMLRKTPPKIPQFQLVKTLHEQKLYCDQDMLAERIEKYLKWRKEIRFLTYTERRTNPFMSPNVHNGESDDGGPDQDLVGGLRFSPEDLIRETVPARHEPTQSRAQAQTWHSTSSWLRRFLRSPPAPPLPISGLPLRGVVEGENLDQCETQRAARPKFAFCRRKTRALVATARRKLNSREIRSEQNDTLISDYSRTAPNLQGSYSNQLLLPMHISPAPSSDAEGLSFLERLVDPEPDPWVKITHVKMENEDSEVEVIRQKDIDLRSVLALRQTPPPSPNHDSSFTRQLAKMAAAKANRFTRSDNQNILGAEETFGDNSSSDEGGL